jgi:hypothetical protein
LISTLNDCRIIESMYIVRRLYETVIQLKCLISLYSPYYNL